MATLMGHDKEKTDPTNNCEKRETHSQPGASSSNELISGRAHGGDGRVAGDVVRDGERRAGRESGSSKLPNSKRSRSFPCTQYDPKRNPKVDPKDLFSRSVRDSCRGGAP